LWRDSGYGSVFRPIDVQAADRPARVLVIARWGRSGEGPVLGGAGEVLGAQRRQRQIRTGKHAAIQVSFCGRGPATAGSFAGRQV